MPYRRVIFNLAFALALAFLLPLPLASQCGGKERWAVKVGSDSRSAQIDASKATPIQLHQLVTLERPALPHGDATRLAKEMKV